MQTLNNIFLFIYNWTKLPFQLILKKDSNLKTGYNCINIVNSKDLVSMQNNEYDLFSVCSIAKVSNDNDFISASNRYVLTNLHGGNGITNSIVYGVDDGLMTFKSKNLKLLDLVSILNLASRKKVIRNSLEDILPRLYNTIKKSGFSLRYLTDPENEKRELFIKELEKNNFDRFKTNVKVKGTYMGPGCSLENAKVLYTLLRFIRVLYNDQSVENDLKYLNRVGSLELKAKNSPKTFLTEICDDILDIVNKKEEKDRKERENYNTLNGGL